MGRWIAIVLMTFFSFYELKAAFSARYNDYVISKNSEKAMVERVENFRDNTPRNGRIFGITMYHANVYLKTNTDREIFIEKMEIPKKVFEQMKNGQTVFVEYAIRNPSKYSRFVGERLFHFYEFFLGLIFGIIAIIALKNGELWEKFK